jgi:L-threonine kinase
VESEQLSEIFVVNRTILDRYPEEIRKSYRAVMTENDMKSRHKLLLELAETTLERLASLAFSTYRNQSWAFPSSDIEQFLRETSTFSFGKYSELLRRSLAKTENPPFTLGGQMVLSNSVMLSKAIQGIQEAVDLEASNIVKIVKRKTAESGGKSTWETSFDLLISYRNKSDGHSRTHNWPVAHVDYFALMTPFLEQAVVELIAAPFIQNAFLQFSVGRLQHTQFNQPLYDHVFDIEDQGVPLRVTTSMETSEASLFPNSNWSGHSTNAYLLKSSGAEFIDMQTASNPRQYHLAGLFHDLRNGGVPVALEIASQPSSGQDGAAKVAAPAAQVLKGKGTAPGTCGELVQGFLSAGAFHVTCPISKSATVSLRVTSLQSWSFTGAGSELGKLCQSIRATAELFDAGAFAVEIDRHTDLDVGKGMGSSTADIVAGARAMASALGHQLSPGEEARIAADIESSDGSMYPGFVAFEQKTGELIEQFSWWPRFAIVMLVPDNTLNTESVSFEGKDRFAPVFEEMLASLRSAATEHDGMMFANAATKSAVLNQQFVPNDWFDDLYDRRDEFGADGVVVAHTGTMIGLLYLMPEDEADDFSLSNAVLRRARKALREIEKMVDGRDVDVELVTTPYPPKG